MTAVRGGWLQREPAAAAAARVFCIPHAGCGAGVFGNWPAVRAGVEFLPIELPGRLARFGETMPATFEELAADLTAGLRPYLDVPYAFFGHCWSALVAYEATAQLERSGGPPPRRLYVSSQLAPQDGPVGKMLGMDDAELSTELEAMIREQGNTPHPELVAIYLKVLRADVEMSRRYVVPDPPRLDCPIVAIGWTEDEDVAPALMAGWPVCGDTGFARFPGRHHRFVDAPDELLNLLCHTMKTAGRGDGPGFT
ncbi:thioesterase II family protein [Nocardia sp. BMG111209]|uniref:thioesterase II family protein n=1 Tax=Nocardia sp. BMG111209 TaxID=1160137 RepID=UPI00035F7498|nr:thioesterase domain-containing protein [Nocardia sp. BMG111209]